MSDYYCIIAGEEYAEDFLYNIANPTGEKWFVYFKDAPHILPPTEIREMDGDIRLCDLVKSLENERASTGYDGIIEISPQAIEQFYPEYKQNYPETVVFFDGGNWYWTQSCFRFFS